MREQVERHEGKLRLLDSQVAMSKLVLRLTTRQRFSAGQEPAFKSLVGETFQDSVQGVVLAGKGLLLVLVALVPWSPLIALFVYLLYRVLRRWRAQNQARRAPAAIAGHPPWGQPPGTVPQSPATVPQPLAGGSVPAGEVTAPTPSPAAPQSSPHARPTDADPRSSETPSSSRDSRERDG